MESVFLSLNLADPALCLEQVIVAEAGHVCDPRLAAFDFVLLEASCLAVKKLRPYSWMRGHEEKDCGR